jgi:hypothetical protein
VLPELSALGDIVLIGRGREGGNGDRVLRGADVDHPHAFELLLVDIERRLVRDHQQVADGISFGADSHHADRTLTHLCGAR